MDRFCKQYSLKKVTDNSYSTNLKKYCYIFINTYICSKNNEMWNGCTPNSK